VGAATAIRGGRKDFRRRKKAIFSLCVPYTVPAPNGDDNNNNNNNNNKQER